MIYIEGILKESIRVINLIFGDLLYIFGLILCMYIVSELFVMFFFFKNKNYIKSNGKNITDIKKMRLDVIKEFYFTPKGKYIDLLKCVNILTLIYLTLNFNKYLFFVTFILNIIVNIYTSTYYNKKIQEILISKS